MKFRIRRSKFTEFENSAPASSLQCRHATTPPTAALLAVSSSGIGDFSTPAYALAPRPVIPTEPLNCIPPSPGKPRTRLNAQGQRYSMDSRRGSVCNKFVSEVSCNGQEALGSKATEDKDISKPKGGETEIEIEDSTSTQHTKTFTTYFAFHIGPGERLIVDAVHCIISPIPTCFTASDVLRLVPYDETRHTEHPVVAGSPPPPPLKFARV